MLAFVKTNFKADSDQRQAQGDLRKDKSQGSTLALH